jgi:signal transduction histidine kinase
MRRSSYIRSEAPATYLGRLPELRHSVAVRLTAWYAGMFTVCILAAVLAFYLTALHAGPGISHHALSELREDFRHYFGIPLGIVIVASTGVGWFMARRALAGIDEVTRTAVEIARGALDRRVPVKGNRDEIDRLAETFNAMVNRVQTLLEQMREITDNIAHDLRSPIARMRGVAEMALEGAASADEQTAMAGTIVEECDRLLAMINTMLDISEAEAGLMHLHVSETDLPALLRDMCDLFQPLAEDKNIRFTLGPAEPMCVPGDPSKLQRIFANLLDNALKYTPPGGEVSVTMAGDDREARVTVEDTGEGIPEEDIPHIFDRFFRGERSRSEAGNGLGLSLAKALVLIHHGSISAASVSGKGARFIVTLPKSVRTA